MKEDEKLFFRLCAYYSLARLVGVWPRRLIDILDRAGVVHYKRSLYFLRKWSDKGFYEYGTSIDLGWIEFDKLPERYAALLEAA